MDKFLKSDDGNNEKKGNSCSGFLFLAINLAQVIVGYLYRNDCELEAANYLFYSGILGLVVSGASLFFTFFIGFMTCCALCNDGKISKGEGCAMGVGCCLYWAMQLGVVVTQIVIMFWGFAVVFPAYSTWTYDLPTEANATIPATYCAYTPMMFAFVLLVIQCIGACLAGPPIMCCLCCAGGLGAIGLGAIATAKATEETNLKEEP